MRKQTKLVAVLSAAALLAIGASMTSFAATSGWAQEGDTWVYLNSSGERVTEQWKRSGDNYFWLDEDGEMATNQIVESNGNFYYVNENGARVSNQWVAVDNEDGDTVDSKEVDVLWYYLGTTGRAYKAEDASMFKTSLINGQRFFFDENGRMVSGWTTTTDGDMYYLGDENQGWATTGWAYLEIPEEFQGQYDVDEAWFNFQSNGKARKDTRAYITNGYYAFDENGVMLDDWQRASEPGLASATTVKLYISDVDESTSDGKTFYNLETGNQASGWVHTYTDDDEGGDEKWFYLVSSDYNRVFNNNGKDAKYPNTKAQKYASGETSGTAIDHVAARTIKNKTYLFDSDGVMLTGVYEFNGPVACSNGKTLVAGIYYFSTKSGATEGSMQKGRTTIDYDGETFTYYFTQNGYAYKNQLNDGSIYNYKGIRVEAKDGNANQVYSVTQITDGGCLKLSSKYFTQGTVVVSSTGKIRTGSVVIDDVKYEISNYVVVKATDRYDSNGVNLGHMFTPPVEITFNEDGSVKDIKPYVLDPDTEKYVPSTN